MMFGFRGSNLAKTSHASDASLEELLAFERLLSELSARFANVSGEQVVAEIESALKQLLAFLGFDRSTFAEFADEGKRYVPSSAAVEGVILCSAAVEGVERIPLGPIPAFGSWFVRELRSGRTIVIRSYEEFPLEAAAAAEHYRRVGIRSQLVIPLPIDSRVVASIGFGAFHDTRKWPDEFIARVKVIGEVMAQALVRKRSEAALRASEERWRSVFETSNLGITIFDRELHYVATNPAFRAMLGYTEEELRQLTALDVTVEGEREVAQVRLAELQQGKIDHYVAVKQYRRKDGTVRWGHSSVSRAAESRPEMFIGTTIDITESKRAQDKLRATQSELARITRLTEVGQMAASITHEISQPLAAIVSGGSAGLRWLSNPTPDLDEVRAVLKSIVSDGNRASQVIGAIRAMFKNVSQEKVLLDVNQVIGEVLALLHSELQNHQILVQTELSPELSRVLADRIQLQQVVANLVTNAMDAMESVDDRARTLRVKSAIREPDGVLITVEDSGPGIDPENVDRIFHPFFTTKIMGMGMGLSICRSIIEAHKGCLSVRSAADRGSIFQIELPA